LPGGLTVYHAGDTTVFGDMKLIGELYAPELACLPIGDLYTMGPREAALAIRLLGVRHVVPMHYGTFPALTGTPEALRELTQDIAGLEARAVDRLAPFARQSDVVVTLTTSRSSLLFPGDASPGSFIAAVGADSPEKQELAPELLAYLNGLGTPVTATPLLDELR